MKVKTVVVVDGPNRTALAVVRSLGRAGYRVFVVSPTIPSLATSSRFCWKHALIPVPSLQPEAAAQAIWSYARDVSSDVIVPTTDLTMDLLLRSRCHQPPPHIAGPTLSAFDALSDKAALVGRARSLNVRVPKTIVVEASSDFAEAAAHIGYPCVAKPHRSEVLAAGEYEHQYVRHLPDEEAARRAIVQYSSAAYPVLIQERIVGDAEGVFLAFSGSGVVAHAAHRRIREYPPSGGASTNRESIEPAADVLDASMRLLESVNWTGAAMVEFKRCASTGAAYLMEVNGRLWGSLQLAIDAGVDFPTICVHIAQGDSVYPAPRFEIGRRSRWFWGEIDHLLARLRHSPSQLGLPSNAPSRLATIGAMLWSGRHTSWEVLDVHDPRPFARETASWIRRRLRRHHVERGT